jgi:PAS domain S-box-containing protein
VSADRQTMLLHAVPLLVLAGLYGLVSILLAVSLVRERRATGLGLGIWLLFTLIGAISAVLAALALTGRDVLAGEPSWLLVLGAAAIAVPGVIVLVGGHDRALLVTARRRVREAEEIATERGREADAISRLSTALSRAQTGEDAAASLFDEVDALLRPDALLLARVDEELRAATGFAARGVDEDWWRTVVLDLDDDTGAIVSVVREHSALAIDDAVTATNVNRALADAVGAKSAAFVPLLSEGDVVGVLVVVTRSRRSFTAAELDVMQGLASEAALALGRARSSEALQVALERERLIAEIGRRVRSELDLDTVLRVAVEETAKAVGVARSFIRLGEPGEPFSVLAEWNAPGVDSVGDAAPHLPALNLAARERRTVAVDDAETSEEIADPGLGDRQALLDLGVRATLGTPIVVFDRVIGVFGLHRAESARWLPGEIALAEAVARELGLAIHTARLLGENEKRLRRQETLIEAAQVLTSDLRFESVIRRLVEEVVALTGADAADCWILEPDSDLLRCRAVVGVPEWNVGRQIPAEGTIGRSLRTGKSVLTHDFATAEQPPPSPPYAVFSDVMSTPITWLGEARGVLGVCAREAGRFDEGDIEVVEVFARFASLALHNAESFEERERQTQAQRGFYRIAQVLGTTLSRAETLDALAQAACDALGGDAALVLELRGSGGPASVTGTHELPEPVRAALAAGGSTPLQPFAGSGALERILASTELPTDDRFDPSLREPLVAEGYGSLLCAPVAGVFRDRSHAVVVLFRGSRAFTDEDVLLTEHLGGAARGALERSELFEGERRARTFSQRLARVGALLATSLDPEVVLDEVAREAPGLLGADAAVIRLLERDELVVRAASGLGTERLVGASTGSATGISGAVAQSRAPVALRDAEDEPRLAHGDLLLEPGTAAACVAVPLVAHGGGLCGVLAVYASTPRAWRDDEVQTLSALAAASSASVANAELYQRVAEEKERSGAILANIADGIVAVDRDGRILLWNAMAEQITGVPASEALGRLVPEVLQRELAADGGESGERYVAVRRGGEEVWLGLSEAVMRDPAGSVAGRIFAFRDVSSERVVEQMRSDFVSTVSHELRTPLTSIYGFAETLRRPDGDFSDAERETFLRYIAGESERLIRIVDDLLDVARLEAGTLDVALEPTEVGRVVREAVASASEQANGSRRFSIQVEPADLAVRANREKFGQVLANLLENAIRYSPEGGTISVAARGRRGVAEITVADEGVGIVEADRERVFTKFFRSERSAAEQGAGLGLFLVRGLVTAMGGRIWVESEEGLGSRFTFELPLAGAEPAARAPAEAAAS